MNTKFNFTYGPLLALLISLSINAQKLTDSLEYSELRNNMISSDGRIAIVNKHFNFDTKKDSVFIFKDGNLILKDLTESPYKEFNKNILTTYNSDKKQLEILDVNTKKKQFIHNISELMIINECELIYFLDLNTNIYKLVKIHNKGIQEVWSSPKELLTYTNINNDQQILFIQYKNPKKGIELINLKTFKKNILTNITYPIKHIIWDKKYPVAFLLPNSLLDNNYPFITFLNYKNNFSKYQTLTNKISFTNIEATSDYSYKIIQKSPLKNKNYDTQKISIWSTNNRYLNSIISSSNTNKRFLKSHLIFNYQENKVYQPQELNEHESIPINKNTFLIFDSNQYHDYTYQRSSRPRDISIYDIKNDILTLITKEQEAPFNTTSLSPNGNYFVYIKENTLFFYNIENKTVENSFNLKEDDLQLRVFNERIRYWSRDENYFYFVSNSNLMEYNTTNNSFKTIIDNKNKSARYKILNRSTKSNYNAKNEIHSNTIENNNKILIKKLNIEDNTLSLLTFEKGIKNPIITNTKDHISDIKYSNDFKTITYSVENFNKPKTIFIYRKGKTKKLLENSMPKKFYNWKKQKIVTYNNKYSTSLKGVLFYPKNFNPNKKYPLITYVYQMQNHLANRFTYLNYYNTDGFNMDLYLERGYFVFYPDILISQQGPGFSALNCVEESIKTILNEEKAINKDKLGLIGYSFGGYATNFIITQTNIFKTAVSGSGPTDIINSYFSYNKGYVSPTYFIYENGQFNMNKHFKEDKELYLRNSPILFADQIKTPLLTFTGDKDIIIDRKQQEELFTAMLRYNKSHIALFYKNEAHSFTITENQIDITKRLLNWFDYYLKDINNKETYWIKYNTSFDKNRITNN
ncbi:alpha/beta hydrolase family protein [Myroides odoratimimus]|uniref:alpha/beta hydrolase family protein n=1 Tax=Myroides odoratimimus TaxID=76832 RepID=UPI0025784729|nr:prolyl oligopeptidase family serine peptidase [Myroides odoratimimus]MDM1415708.1 S9 family peptidase [Myroides odoratimimus]